MQGDPHPPVYWVMLKLWMMVAGESEVAIRLLTVFFGIIFVAPHLCSRAQTFFVKRRRRGWECRLSLCGVEFIFNLEQPRRADVYSGGNVWVSGDGVFGEWS